MKEKYTHDKYVEIMENKINCNLYPEDDYKDLFIPNSLFKYSSFKSSHIDENIENICLGKIWMPLASSLNDPFEYQMIKDNLSEERKIEIRKDIIERNTILSLCPSFNNNLLWSHYADGHRGLCMEFKVIDKGYAFPITYLKRQEDMTEILEKWLKSKRKLLYKPVETWTNDENALVASIRKIMLYKRWDWKYEEEIRIIGRNIEKEIDEDKWAVPEGYWEKLSNIGLHLQRIILGFNCSISNKAKVVEFVNNTNEIIIMTEMQNNDFKYSRDYTIDYLKKSGKFIKIAQMIRQKNGINIYPKNMKEGKDGVIYEWS